MAFTTLNGLGHDSQPQCRYKWSKGKWDKTTGMQRSRTSNTFNAHKKGNQSWYQGKMANLMVTPKCIEKKLKISNIPYYWAFNLTGSYFQ